MSGKAVVLGPGEGRRFWTAISNGAVKVESGSADFSVILPSPEAENPPAGVRSERASADVGLIGLGQIGQVHAAAIRRSPVARLAAMARSAGPCR